MRPAPVFSSTEHGEGLAAPSREKDQPAFIFPSHFLSQMDGETNLVLLLQDKPAAALAGGFQASLAGGYPLHWGSSIPDKILRNTFGDLWWKGDEACLLA